MIIEVLYPEVGNLFGDLANISYLEKSVKCKIIYTKINEEPHFVKNQVDLIYMGSMTENSQEIVIKALRNYKEKIDKLIKENQFFLITGNAVEVFGKYIQDGNKKIEALNIFDFYSKRDFSKHHASYVLGEYNDMKIIGYKSQFSHSYKNKRNFIKVLRGYGFDKISDNEGIHYKNFYGTYLIGPLLIMNPYFTEYLLNKMKIKYTLAFKEDVIKNYNKKLKDFENENVNFIR